MILTSIRPNFYNLIILISIRKACGQMRQALTKIQYQTIIIRTRGALKILESKSCQFSKYVVSIRFCRSSSLNCTVQSCMEFVIFIFI